VRGGVVDGSCWVNAAHLHSDCKADAESTDIQHWRHHRELTTLHVDWRDFNHPVLIVCQLSEA
jgi:hypothetical protein